MRSKILIFFLILFCCGPSEHSVPLLTNILYQPQIFTSRPIYWAFDCKFPEEYRQSAREGFAYWNTILQTNIFKETSECGAVNLIKEVGSRIFVTYVPEENKDRKEILATTQIDLLNYVPNSGIIRYYEPWIRYDSFQSRASVSRHEVGHVLGMDHFDKKSCLMYPVMDMEKYGKKIKNACKLEIQEMKKYYSERETP